jgi:hypothetical protein
MRRYPSSGRFTFWLQIVPSTAAWAAMNNERSTIVNGNSIKVSLQPKAHTQWAYRRFCAFDAICELTIISANAQYRAKLVGHLIEPRHGGQKWQR